MDREGCRLTRVGAGVMMLGSLCPWASALGLFSLSGLQVRYGWVTLTVGLAILALDLRGAARFSRLVARRRAIGLRLAVAGAGVCVLVLLGVNASPYGALIDTSCGLYLTLAAATGTAWAARRERPWR